MTEKTSNIAFIDWARTKNNSLQPFHLINSDSVSYTLCENFAFSINTKKELFMWGNLFENNSSSNKDFLLSYPEKIIFNPLDKNISKIVTNSKICLILTNSGSLYVMGTDKNENGLFGLGNEMRISKKPILVEYFGKNNIFITDIDVANKIAVSLSVTNNIYIWGSIISKNKRSYKLSEPRLLFQLGDEENEINFRKMECTDEDLYFIDSKGVVYYYSIENIDYIEKKLNIITSLCNIPIKEICLNKSAGFLICLSQGGDIYIIVREEIIYLIPKHVSLSFYSFSTSHDRLDCLGKDVENNIYFMEWNFLRSDSKKKILPQIKNARIYKISSNNIKSIELLNSYCKDIICFVITSKNDNKKQKNSLNQMEETEYEPCLLKDFDQSQEICFPEKDEESISFVLSSFEKSEIYEKKIDFYNQKTKRFSSNDERRVSAEKMKKIDNEIKVLRSQNKLLEFFKKKTNNEKKSEKMRFEKSVISCFILILSSIIRARKKNVFCDIRKTFKIKKKIRRNLKKINRRLELKILQNYFQILKNYMTFGSENKKCINFLTQTNQLLEKKILFYKNYFFNILTNETKNEKFKLFMRYHKSTFLALTIKNEISKYLQRRFNEIKRFSQKSLLITALYDKLLFFMTLEKIMNKKQKELQKITMKNFEVLPRKNYIFDEKTLKFFSRGVERMIYLRKTQVFFSIKNHYSLKQNVITLSSIDLEDENEILHNNKCFNNKENWNPNQYYEEQKNFIHSQNYENQRSEMSKWIQNERNKFNSLKQISLDSYRESEKFRDRSKERLNGIYNKIEKLNELFTQTQPMHRNNFKKNAKNAKTNSKSKSRSNSKTKNNPPKKPCKNFKFK